MDYPPPMLDNKRAGRVLEFPHYQHVSEGESGGGRTLGGMVVGCGEETDVSMEVTHHGTDGDFADTGFSGGVFVGFPNAVCEIIPCVVGELPIQVRRMFVPVLV